MNDKKIYLNAYSQRTDPKPRNYYPTKNLCPGGQTNLIKRNCQIKTNINRAEATLVIRTIKEQAKPKRLTDKQMRELLLSLKKEADKMPEEEDSFGVEVICSGKDMAKGSSTKQKK
ncbi:15766_t:CDS:2 [Entrophospora sp. SA101]|nr:15766_t:CDS:2 [Entrophospora sp. SA101]